MSRLPVLSVSYKMNKSSSCIIIALDKDDLMLVF